MDSTTAERMRRLGFSDVASNYIQLGSTPETHLGILAFKVLFGISTERI